MNRLMFGVLCLVIMSFCCVYMVLSDADKICSKIAGGNVAGYQSSICCDSLHNCKTTYMLGYEGKTAINGNDCIAWELVDEPTYSSVSGEKDLPK